MLSFDCDYVAGAHPKVLLRAHGAVERVENQQ